MATSADLFPALQNMSFADLTRRRAEILGDRTNAKALSDEELDELAAIVSLLRRKQSGPPRDTPPEKKTSTPKALTDEGLFSL